MSENHVRHLYLIDGSGFIFRAYHAMRYTRQPLTRSDGTPIGAVLGFCNMVLRLQEQHNIDAMAVIFDAKRQNFRHEIYPDYKANRQETPEDLIPQFAIIREACDAFNLPQLELEGYEADDLIATLVQQAAKAGIATTVVSSDKDLMQLMSDQVYLYDPMKDKLMQPEDALEKFGVPAAQILDVQALVGDSSDNIPGVPGIGVKTAAELIRQFETLDNLMAHLDQIPQQKRRETLQEHKHMAFLSRDLARLATNAPISLEWSTLRLHEPDYGKLQAFLHTQGFRNLLSRLEKRGKLPGGSPLAADAAPLPPKTPTGTYQLVQDLAMLKDILAQARASGLVAFDTETNSLDALRADLVGFSLCVDTEKSYYIPLQHKTPTAQLDLLGDTSAQLLGGQIPLADALAALKELLENPAVAVVGHNIKYDALVLAKYGLEIAAPQDSMILSYNLFGSAHGHGMDELARLYLGHETIKYQDVTGTGKNQVTFDFVPLDKACAYAAEDAEVTLRLYQAFKAQILARQAHQVYYTIDLPMVQVLKRMEEKGILVDPAALKSLATDFETRIRTLEEAIFTLAGLRFNIASPKQLGDVLFGSLGLQGAKKTKTGLYATDVEVLEKLSTEGHEIADKLIQWRQLTKLKSTYADTLLEQINPRTQRIHTSYGLTIAATGRLSSSDPNLQNIPVRTEEGRKIRDVFIAPPGSKLVSMDYSQIELRLLAHMGQIDSLRTAFKNGQDIHAITAAEVFGVPLDQVDSLMRRKAKAINFGIIYGISAFGLAQQLHISRTEAGAYIELYAKKYPGILQFMEAQKESARRDGFVRTLFGRKIYIQGIFDKNPAMRAFAERQAINAPLQGTAADIIKKAMIQIDQHLRQRDDAKLLLQIHDELLFEMKEPIDQTLCAQLKSLMERTVILDVPLIAEVGTGRTWTESHS